jgi:hypothetical protein
MNRVTALGLTLAAAACSAPTGPAAEPQPDPTFRVELERGMCLGPCPVYKVAIDHTGLVAFTGSNSNIAPNVPCQGARQWRIEPAKVLHLEALIDRSGFFGFKPEYMAGITDQPAYVVTVTRRGQTKRVQDYVGQMVGMPAAMTQIEDAVDIAAGDKDCVVAAASAANAP